MRTITEYINESNRLDEAKKVKVEDVRKGLEKIANWATENNIKKLMSEYMSAGDAEDLDKSHWEACVSIVDWMGDKIGENLSDMEPDETISIDKITDWITDRIEEEDMVAELNGIDKEGDWDDDEIINLFNTVSTKVCKEAWLI